MSQRKRGGSERFSAYAPAESVQVQWSVGGGDDIAEWHDGIWSSLTIWAPVRRTSRPNSRISRMRLTWRARIGEVFDATAQTVPRYLAGSTEIGLVQPTDL